MMRVFYVSNMYPSEHHKSYGVFVKKLEQEMTEHHFTIVRKAVICGKGSNIFDKLHKYLTFYSEIIHGFFKAPYDIIYIHYLPMVAPVLWFLLIIKTRKFVVNIHGGDLIPLHFFEKIFQPLSKRLIRKAALIVVPSVYFQKETLKRYGNSLGEKIFVYPSGGVDVSVFRPAANPVKNECLHIGYVSRIDSGKGWDIFVKALNILKEKNIAFKATMAGDGQQMVKLKNMIVSLSLDAEVALLGEVENTKLPSIFNTLDVFVFPTLLPESLGLVAIEAMACEPIVIASRIGALPEYITHRYNGFLFTPGSEIDLCKCLLEYLNMDEKQRLTMKENARNTAMKYSKENTFKGLQKKLYSLND